MWGVGEPIHLSGLAGGEATTVSAHTHGTMDNHTSQQADARTSW
jgi:hypothetical protein